MTGLVYACPPVKLIDSYVHRGPGKQHTLGTYLAEIELLAVMPRQRRNGAGSILLEAREQQLASGGGRFVLAKVRAGQHSVMRWNRRGCAVAGVREPVRLVCGPVRVTCDDGGSGHHLVVKPLHSEMALKRCHAATGSYLISPEYARMFAG